MRYMIHAVPSRLWYVNDFLIPSMLEQGIAKEDICVYCDWNRKGNLFSFMDSIHYCGKHPVNGGTWHLQDDIVLSKNFAETTRNNNSGVVCGTVIKDWGPNPYKTGLQPVNELWFSFQCIRIPDELAKECSQWFYTDASKRKEAKYRNRILRNKHDDDFFQFFLFEKHPYMQITNLKPNIVDHIDYMLGGSLINSERSKKINRAVYWEDEHIIKDLEQRLVEYTESKIR